MKVGQRIRATGTDWTHTSSMASERVAKRPEVAGGRPAHRWVAVVSTVAATVIALALVGGANPFATAAVIVTFGLCLTAMITGWLPGLAVALTAIGTVGLWDLFEAHSLRPVVGVATLALAGAVLMATNRGRLHPAISDLGAAFVVLAASIPALVSRELQPVLGIVATVGGTYLVARVSPLGRKAVLSVALWIGAAHGVAALIAVAFGIARLLPVPDPDSALATSRGIGLYLNPNSLGNVEAVVLALALWWGIRRRQIPLLILVLAGLVLSGSREAVLGAAVAMVAIGLVHPGRVTLVAAASATAFVLAFVLLPEIASRFDPANLTTDPSVAGRLSSWDQALRVIRFSPGLGQGLASTQVIDQAYLGWLVRGGILGALIWVIGLALLTIGSQAWPVVVVMAVGGLLANTFDGPALMLLLLIAGVTAGLSRDVSGEPAYSFPDGSHPAPAPDLPHSARR